MFMQSLHGGVTTIDWSQRPHMMTFLQNKKMTTSMGDTHNVRCCTYVQYLTYFGRVINFLGLHFEDPFNYVILEFKSFDGMVS